MAHVPRQESKDEHRIINHIVIHTHTMGCLRLVLLTVQRIGKWEEQGGGYKARSVVLGFALRDLGASYWEILSHLTREGKQVEKVSVESVKRPKIESDREWRREGKVHERGGGGAAGQTFRYWDLSVCPDGACVRGRGSLGSRSGVRGQRGKEGYTDIRNNKGSFICVCM